VPKPTTLEGYSEQVTRDCERVLVTLLRNLGPHRESLVLVGGLTRAISFPNDRPWFPNMQAHLILTS
jgi:hypothetical protein